jgi:ABC-2 type transport system ATP-binding protein
VVADGVLEIDGLSKRYGSVLALDGVSFDLGAGELFGFVGPNGAGKTSTMRIVLGVLAADAGEVRWRGRPITFATRRRIGYMPEERGLYPSMGVTEQLVYLAELHGMRAPAARAAAAHWLERLGLGDRGGEQLQKLSQGNQQRVQLAAALLFSPEVLVLDEPFSGLDPVAVDVMSAVLREQADAGISVLFSSHQLELVEQLCDRVGIIRAGRMLAVGSVAELRAGSAPRYWVDAPDATLVRQEDSRVLIELATPAADQSLLQVALTTGPVREFRRDLPSLTELFRNVVAEEPGAEGATAHALTEETAS